MRRFLQRVTLVTGSLVVGLALAELGLAVDGRYNSVVTRELVASPAIWAPPADETDYEAHPDLNLEVEIRLDSQGIRNHGDVSTEAKPSIIGFFGDSFTDNRRIADQFTFTTLLDGIAQSPARVVSYGVDGYGLDQSYLRYRKYEAHDIRHVVYLFCGNDLRNLYETGLVEYRDSQIVFRRPGPRFLRRLLGRVRLTYLVMGAYRRLWGTAPDVLPEAHADRDSRFKDAYAATISDDFLSTTPGPTAQLAETFVMVLRKWQEEVEGRGRTFTVLVLPRESDTALAGKLLRPFGGRVIYLREYFPDEMVVFFNDGHWNEYGNLQMASVLTALDRLPFHSEISQRALSSDLTRAINRYYEEHSPRPRRR